jgi:hypothetical protein
MEKEQGKYYNDLSTTKQMLYAAGKRQSTHIFCEDEDSKVEESACFITKLCRQNTGI